MLFNAIFNIYQRMKKRSKPSIYKASSVLLFGWKSTFNLL